MRAVVRAWPMLVLAGCVPISADEYAGGSPLDAGVPTAELRDDASAPSLDATFAEDVPDVLVPPPPVREEADARVEDASLDASLDATVDAMEPEPTAIDCTTRNVVCDDFEVWPLCPNRPGPNWTECEHLADPTGPVREPLGGGGWALRSRVSETAGMRSQRLLRMIPLDADYFEADFWMITDPTSSEWFTFVKLQQEAGMDAEGEPTNYPGVSLIGRSGKMGVAVESMESLDQSYYAESDLGPWPSGWIHVNFAVELKGLRVTVRFEEYEPSKGWQSVTYPVGKVAIGRQYFTLGVYAESAGAVQILFDDVRIHAAKNGRVIPLL